ncbi:MAG: isoprenylcysteine carboxylmethyltransferase family protein [Bdellovibrionales bacterium]|nr:isoprenylcysteine carboxylmethyltransferase family protein [Bdellovibrionales bacterium]
MTPPWLFLISLLLGIALEFVFPTRLAEGSAGMIAGSLLIASGLAFVLWSGAVFKRMQTAIEPGSRPSMFATSGPYQWSRNPMYLGLAVIHFGIALIVNSVWLFLTTFMVLVALDRRIVPREEALLGEMYPEEYAKYRRRVRRWF